MNDKILLDKGTLEVLHTLVCAHQTAADHLDTAAEGNIHAASIDFDIVVRYEGEPWATIGFWHGDWSEVIPPADLDQPC